MSLQVWLPLNGNLHNQGLADITVTNNGATVDNNGKIGKCYYFNGSSQYLQLSKSLTNLYAGDFSWAIWLKPTDATRGIIFSEYASTGASNVAFELLANRVIRVYWAASPDWSTGISIEQNVWSHVAITRHENILKVYVNGELKATKSDATLANKTSSSFIRLGDDYRGGTSVSYMGYMNDARIYNHALSAKEVEEIAKGLILHYKLDNNYTTNENLMPNHLEMGLGSANPSTGTWRLAGSSSMTKSRVQILDSPEGPCYGFQNEGIQTPNDGSCYGIDSFPLEGNSIYTISMWARIINGTEGYAGYNIYNSTDKGGSHSSIQKNYRVTQLPSNGDWIKCWYTFTTNSNNTRNIYIGIVTGETSVTTQMCCVHIEKVDATTYTTIYDSSGYSNNGTIVGSLTTSTPSPRYSCAMKFNGNTSCIKIPYNEINSDRIFTVNLWFHKDALGSKNYETLFGGPSGFEMDTRAGASTTLSLYMASTRGGNAFSPFNLNEWYMVTMVRNGTNEMYYINGELKKTIEAKSMPSGQYRIGAWASDTGQNYYGDISDFRIYATALTPEQIKELYNTSMSIDKNGNIHARELVEL